MKSIRRFLTISLVAGVGSVVLATTVTLYFALERGLVAEFDRAIASKAKTLGTFVERDGDFIEFGLPAGGLPEFEGGLAPEYFQVWLADGRPIRRSPTLGEEDLSFSAGAGKEGSGFDLQLPDGRPGRAVLMRGPVHAEDSADDAGESADQPESVHATAEEAVVVVARSRESLDLTLNRFKTGLLGAALTIVIGSCLLVTQAVRRGLRPLEDLATKAASIDARDLSARMPEAGQPREVGLLSARLNELLERLESAFERERRMTANLAHELRTPIAELTLTGDLAQRFDDDPEFLGSLVQSVREVSQRMDRIVSSLLRLARIESGQEKAERKPIDLPAVVEAAWEELRGAATRRGITIEFRHEALAVESDTRLLRLAVANLLENAIAHSPEGSGLVSVVEDHAAGQVAWRLANPAPTLQAADLPHLTEAFWRGDSARSSPASSGLGLAITAATIEVVGGKLEFTLEEGRLEAGVLLPASVSPEPVRLTFA